MFGKKNLLLMAYTCIIGAVLLVLPLSFTYDPDPPHIAEIEVGPGYPIESIQRAINMADEGTVITVHGGEYRESLMITKGITIRSAPGETFTVRGDVLTRGPPLTRGIMVVIASPTPVTIDGGDYNFSGTTWNDSAIKVQYGDNHVIKNANFSDSKQGVWVHGNDHEDLSTIKNIRILDCRFTNISGHAIYLQGTWAEVENNYINKSGDGIMVAFNWIAPNPQVGSIRDNRIENCSVGVNIVDSVV